MSYIVGVNCEDSSQQSLSIRSAKDFLIYDPSGFTILFGFCNSGPYARTQVTGRIYDASGRLETQSQTVTCNKGMYSTKIQTVSPARDHYLEIEIIGLDENGRSHTNLPASRPRVFYPAERSF